MRRFLWPLILVLTGIVGCEELPWSRGTRILPGRVEHLCSALCTYRTASGSIQRIGISATGDGQDAGWLRLGALCAEIQRIGVRQGEKVAAEPLVASETKVVNGSSDYGFRLATKVRDCEQRTVSK